MSANVALTLGSCFWCHRFESLRRDWLLVLLSSFVIFLLYVKVLNCFDATLSPTEALILVFMGSDINLKLYILPKESTVGPSGP
jgi:uncharacterized membrane protein